ncbi:MAG: FecR family protein [Ignavibacteria bacterium]|jgi:ferric-dicitrate binding protein FerR (iron transport regulator)
MNELNNWGIIAKYLSNECTADEKIQVENWINESSENKKSFELLKKVWQKEQHEKEIDLEKLWSKVELEAGIKNNESNNDISFFNKIPNFLKYAAAIMIIISSAYLVTRNLFTNESPQIQLITHIVPNGEKSELLLSDGSKVFLDSGSKLVYPEIFEKDKREVQLSGEAYFDVESNKEAPFIITTNTSQITVLGTEFNVSAWETQNKVVVTVNEGLVRFNSLTAPENKSVKIAAGETSSTIGKNAPQTPQAIDKTNFVDWKNNEAKFNGVALKEILFTIERWYDLNIKVNNRNLLNEKLTIHIKENTAKEILDLISLLINTDYVKNENNITF